MGEVIEDPFRWVNITHLFVSTMSSPRLEVRDLGSYERNNKLVR